MKQTKKFKGEMAYRIFTPLLRVLFRLYYNPKIIHKEVIPKEGSILLVGNHKHVYDQCLTIMATKRVIHYMAKKEYFDGHFAWFFKMFGCISVNRQIHDHEATEQALDILNHQGAVGLFPEGTRNKTKKFLLPFKFGAVSMAQKTGATIVPFGLTGDYKFRSKNLTIRYGTPFQVPKDMSLEEPNEKLYHEVERLMRENLKERP